MADPMLDRLDDFRRVLTWMAATVEGIDWSMLDMCDCGHRQIEHEIPKFTRDGTDRCGHDGCDCLGFDDVHQRIHAARRREQERLRQEQRQEARELRAVPNERQEAA